MAIKNGRKIVQKLETRIKELENQLDGEQRRLVEGQKNHRRIERRINELSFQQEEDHKNHERMQELVDKLQGKVNKEVQTKSEPILKAFRYNTGLCSDSGILQD